MFSGKELQYINILIKNLALWQKKLKNIRNEWKKLKVVKPKLKAKNVPSNV